MFKSGSGAFVVGLALSVAGCTCGEGGAVTIINDSFASIKNAQTCAGGSVQIGPPPKDGLSYQWSPETGLSSATVAQPIASPSETTTYTLTITDSNKQQRKGELTVTVFGSPVLALDGPRATCAGAPVAIGTAAAAGLTYAWSPAEGLSATDVASPTASPASTTTYTLTATDVNGCSTTATQQVTVHALPTARIVAPDAVCSGSDWNPDGSTSSAEGGAAIASYSWDFDGDGAEDATAADPAGIAITADFTATLKVTDSNGCVATATAPVTARTLPQAVISAPSATCEGAPVPVDAAGSAAAGGATLVSYEWDFDSDGAVDDTGVVPASAPTASPALAIGLRVVDSNGCAATAATTPTVLENPTARITQDALYCDGAPWTPSGATSTAAAAATIASYEWDFDGDGAADATGPAPAAPAASAGTTATLKVTDSNNCSGTATAQPAVAALPTAVIRASNAAGNVCEATPWAIDAVGSSAAAPATLASYEWDYDGNLVPDAYNETPTSLPTAADGLSVSLVVTDSNGCKATATRAPALWRNPVAQISVASDEVCTGQGWSVDGGSSSATAPATLTGYAWDFDRDGNVDALEAAPATPPTASAGLEVELRVTDSNGCQGTATRAATVLENPTAAIDAAAEVCSEATYAVSAASSSAAPANGTLASFEWDFDDDGQFDDATGAAPAGPVAADGLRVSVRVTDDKGCFASTSTSPTVLVNPTAVISAPSGEVCSGAPWSVDGLASVSGSAPLSTWEWDFDGDGAYNDATGSTPSSLPSSTGAALPVALRVTDAKGCFGSASRSATVNPLPVANAGADQTMGLGGWLTVGELASGGTAPYTYAWTASVACSSPSCISDAAAAQPSVSPPSTSNFTVAVTDAKGCQASDAMQMTVVEALVANAGADTAVCAGESATVGQAATGAVAPYTYAWTASPACSVPVCQSSDTTATVTVTPSSTTTFTQSVSDSAGSTTSDAVVVTVHPLSVVTAGADRNADPATQTTLGAAPVAGETYAWSCNRSDCALSDPAVPQPTATPTLSTSYTLTATTAEGCPRTSSVTVYVNLLPVTLPTDGSEGHPVNAKLFVQFDQDILASSLAGNFTLQDANTGVALTTTATLVSARLVAIDPPTSGYVASDDYTLTVRGGLGGVQSTDATLPNVLPADLVVSYSTGNADNAAPSITYRSPAVNALGVFLNAAVVAQFDEPLDPTSVTTASVVVTDNASGATIPGTLTYSWSTQALTFVPSIDFAANTGHTVTLTNLRDAAGNALTTSWSFTTGTTRDVDPPTVTATTPTDGATGIAVFPASPGVTATFNEAVDEVSLRTGMVLRNVSTGALVAGTVTFNPATFVAVFTPSAALLGNTSYRLEVSNVRDLSLNAMTSTAQTTFTTATVLFADDFETDITGRWTVGGAKCVALPSGGSWWTRTTAAFRSRTHSLTDSASGNYADSADCAATVSSLDISARGSNAVSIQYWVRTRTKRPTDFVDVDYSLNGTAWTKLATHLGTSPFSLQTFTLSPAQLGTATSLWLRLRFQSNVSKNLDGVHFDDVYVMTP